MKIAVTRASTAANQDVQKLSRFWLQIQHFFGVLLLLSVMLLPRFVQLGQEGANIPISQRLLSLSGLLLIEQGAGPLANGSTPRCDH